MLEGCSLLLFALMLQPLSALITQQDNSPAFTLYVFAGLQGSLDLAAILSWGIGMRDYCADNNCLQSGFRTAIAGFLTNIIGTVLACGLYWRRNSYTEHLEIQQRKWCRVGVLASELLSFLLVLLSLAWPEWIRGSEWSGGLLRCEDCPYQAQRVGWDCFAGVVCDNQGASELCSLFSSLRDSGRTVTPT